MGLNAFLCTAAGAQDVDIWLGNLDMAGGRVAITNLENITHRPGYDNQPAFFPGGKTLAYTTEAGAETHMVLFDIATRKATQLVNAQGFSPTPTPDGTQLMVLHDGRVELHDLNGRLVRPLTETKDAGHFSTYDERTWALFMNDKERRIAIYDADKKTLETMSVGGDTPLYRVPGEPAFTFVAEVPFSSDSAVEAKFDRSAVKLELRKLDMVRRSVEVLATIPFPASGHHVWTSRKTVLIASGGTIYEWNPAAPTTWKPVAVLPHPDQQHITRIAISPMGDLIALVSMPRDETLIRDARIASNAAIVAHDVNGIAETMEDSIVVTRGSGARLAGIDEVKESFTDGFAQQKGLVYKRTTTRVEVSASNPLAAEHGTWVGTWTTADGKHATASGTYLAMWRNSIGATDGIPDWKIRSELYVTLDCKHCK